MYWAAKKEVDAIRRGKWQMASRVLWQHELTPEQAVQACVKKMEPQIDRAIHGVQAGHEPELGEGPMSKVDPSNVAGYYVEIDGPDGSSRIPPFFVPLDDDE